MENQEEKPSQENNENNEPKVQEVSWTKTKNSIIVSFGGEVHSVHKDDSAYEEIVKALQEGKDADIPNIVSPAKQIENFSNNEFRVIRGEVFIGGNKVPVRLGKKIVEFAKEKLPHRPLINFFNNLNENPSNRAVNELFDCLDRNHHPITKDGHFIAYKKVREDFTDTRTGTFNNSVGQIVSVKRNQVDENCEKICSFGLHVASFKYAQNWGGKHLLKVKVNPRDVVAVPIDYNRQKMRVCQYEVLDVINEESLDKLYDEKGTEYERRYK